MVSTPERRSARKGYFSILPDSVAIDHTLKNIDELLSAFRSCFSRTATYKWFVVVIVGLMLRTDHLGVPSKDHRSFMHQAVSIFGSTYIVNRTNV
ncbi:hypothetical protein D3C77_573490 [compost metagenome]